MRIKLFERCDPAMDVDKETLLSFQNRVNTWLRKAQRHPQYRILNQSVCMSGPSDGALEIVVSIWYEKVPPKE